MGLKNVDLHAPLAPIEWLVEGLIPKGYLTIVGSLPGQGKTAILTGLAWQLSRPSGEFIGRNLPQTSTVYLDFDAPGEGRGLRTWLERHKSSFPNGNLSMIHALEPDADTFGLGDKELEELTQAVQASKAGLIVLDSFMAAFGGVDPNRLEKVQAPLWFLRRLATQTGAAVVLVDHLPKPVGGEKAGARGIMGSQAKQAQARAVHILTRIPPKEVEGRHVLRWEATKMSYAALPDPFGIEMHFSAWGLELLETDLPEGYSDTRTEKASRAVQDYLEAHPNVVVPKQDLVALIAKEFNLSKRPQDKAIGTALKRLGEAIEKVRLPGQGSPVGYKLVDPGIQEFQTEFPALEAEDVLDTPRYPEAIPVSNTLEPTPVEGEVVFLDLD